MNKVSIKGGWPLALIPIVCTLIFTFPQLQKVFSILDVPGTGHQSNIQKLDSLKQIENPTFDVEFEMAQIEALEVQHEKQRYFRYQITGMMAILAVFLIGIVVFPYITKRKKLSSANRRIDFSYSNPYADPIGQYISEDAMLNSGTNFVTAYLKKTHFGHKITSSNYFKFIWCGVTLIGVNSVLWTVVEYIEQDKETLSPFLAFGVSFMLVGLFFLFQSSSNKVIIDEQNQNIKVDGEVFHFSQLHALQILQKFVRGNRRGGLFCYELNLVTKQGERYNLLNHGDKTYLLSDMVKISKILKLPVWNVGV